MVDGYLLLSLPIYKQTRRGNDAASFPIPGYVLLVPKLCSSLAPSLFGHSTVWSFLNEE